MAYIFGRGGAAYGQHSSGVGRWVRRIALLAFAVIQLLLVARILLDLGAMPETGWHADVIVTTSDALAAPVEGLSDAMGGFLGGGGPAGDGFDPVMMAALVGWTAIEGLVMRVIGKFAAAVS